MSLQQAIERREREARAMYGAGPILLDDVRGAIRAVPWPIAAALLLNALVNYARGL